MSNTWQSVETALFPIVSSINQYLSNYIFGIFIAFRGNLVQYQDPFYPDPLFR